MDSSPQHNFNHHLNREELATFTNKRIIDKLPSILSIILTWGSNKKPDQNFRDYLTLKKGINEMELDEIFGECKTKLLQTSCGGLDVTFMLHLLPLLCTNVARVGSQLWRNRSLHKNNIEYYLDYIRKMRNAVVHDPLGAAVDRNQIDKLFDITEKLLDHAGDKFCQRAEEIHRAKEKLKQLIIEIKSTAITDQKEDNTNSQMLIVKKSRAVPILSVVSAFFCGMGIGISTFILILIYTLYYLATREPWPA